MRKKNRNKYYLGNVSDFKETKGYFIGHFMGERGFPLLETEEVEVAWKKLPVTEFDEKLHFHRRSVEVNIVISGGIKLRVGSEEVKLKKGDFLVVYPETKAQKLSVGKGTEVITIKSPSVPGDKFEAV